MADGKQQTMTFDYDAVAKGKRLEQNILLQKGDTIVVQRAFDQGTEMVKCPLPCLLTVVGTAAAPRRAPSSASPSAPRLISSAR